MAEKVKAKAIAWVVVRWTKTGHLLLVVVGCPAEAEVEVEPETEAAEAEAEAEAAEGKAGAETETEIEGRLAERRSDRALEEELPGSCLLPEIMIVE